VTNWVTITTNTCGLPRILPDLFPQVSPGSPLAISQYYYVYTREVTGSIPVPPTRQNGSAGVSGHAQVDPLRETTFQHALGDWAPLAPVPRHVPDEVVPEQTRETTSTRAAATCGYRARSRRPWVTADDQSFPPVLAQKHYPTSGQPGPVRFRSGRVRHSRRGKIAPCSPAGPSSCALAGHCHDRNRSFDLSPSLAALVRTQSQPR